MNVIVSGRGTERASRQAGQRCLKNSVLTSFEPGQPVVWTYRSQVPPYQIYLVAAEVVHGGPIRVRIRLQDTAGNLLLRWVKPDATLLASTNECAILNGKAQASVEH